LLISGLLLTFKSCRASLKSAATSAEEIDMMGTCLFNMEKGDVLMLESV
jgi:hypothetical protein